MTIPKVSQEAREYVARFGRTQEWLEEDVTAVLDGKRDLSNLVQSFAQFEQLIRSMVIDEAAGVADDHAQAWGLAMGSGAVEIAKAIRQLGERGRG